VSAHAGLGCEQKGLLTLKGNLLPERKEIPTGIPTYCRKKEVQGKESRRDEVLLWTYRCFSFEISF